MDDGFIGLQQHSLSGSALADLRILLFFKAQVRRSEYTNYTSETSKTKKISEKKENSLLPDLVQTHGKGSKKVAVLFQ